MKDKFYKVALTQDGELVYVRETNQTSSRVLMTMERSYYIAKADSPAIAVSHAKLEMSVNE